VLSGPSPMCFSSFFVDDVNWIRVDWFMRPGMFDTGGKMRDMGRRC
jgi:hypothetical protein